MRLVFHIGLHKTGSTFLQSALHRNAPELHRRGVHYAPAGGLVAHHDIAWAMLRGDFRPLTTALTDPGIDACETVVLSSEDFESLLFLPQLAQEAEQLAQSAGFDRVEWHASLRRQDEYFWSLYSEMSKHVFVDPIAIFHEVMQRGYLYLEGATGTRAGAPFWHFCFNWSLVEEFASRVRGETMLYRFADEVPFPGRGFIASLTGGAWSLPPGPASEQEVNARLSDPEVHENYVLRFVDPLEESGRDRLAAIIRRRARIDPRLKTLINKQLQARYIAANQGVLERLAGRPPAMPAPAKARKPKGRLLRVAANLAARAGASSGDVSVAAARAGNPGRRAPDLDRDPPPPHLMPLLASPMIRPSRVAVRAPVKLRSRQILARSLDGLGRLISTFGRLISHFGGEMQVRGGRAALRSTSRLVKSRLREQWILARHRRAVTLAQTRQWIRLRLPLPSRRGVLFIGREGGL